VKAPNRKRIKKKSGVSATKVKDTFLEFLLEQLSELGTITVKVMFGGKTLFCDGVVFALIDEGVLFLKADDLNRPVFQARGLPPFKPFKDQPGVMQYYQPPPEVFEDRVALLRWCGEAVGAGRRAAARRNKKKKSVG
jgi:DNA transformation protein